MSNKSTVKQSPVRNSEGLPPAEIIAAAEQVRQWMTKNGHKYWQLGGVCDRRYALAPLRAGGKIGHE